MALKQVVLPAPLGPIEAEDLAAPDGEAHLVQGGEAAELDGEISCLQERFAFRNMDLPVQGRGLPRRSRVLSCLRLAVARAVRPGEHPPRRLTVGQQLLAHRNRPPGRSSRPPAPGQRTGTSGRRG